MCVCVLAEMSGPSGPANDEEVSKMSALRQSVTIKATSSAVAGEQAVQSQLSPADGTDDRLDPKCVPLLEHAAASQITADGREEEELLHFRLILSDSR
jgi:hypothetical protein